MRVYQGRRFCDIRTLLLFVLFFCTSVLSDPKPNPKAVVLAGNARFTILTPRVIRMEYDQNHTFLDAPSWKFISRNLSIPNFQIDSQGDWLSIRTDFLHLEYLQTSNQSFESDNLRVTVKLENGSTEWVPTQYSNTKGNLLGTVRTLDGVDGDINLDCKTQKRSDLHCAYGVISRSGYVVIDDTNLPYWEPNELSIPWIVNKTYPTPSGSVCSIPNEKKRDCGWPGISSQQCMNKGCCYVSKWKMGGPFAANIPTCYYSTDAHQDLYIFGHGHDYFGALKDFTQISGKIPIPPRFTFGIFYSRYWAYNDVELMDLVRNYEDRNIPLDVLVTDMDWHLTFYKEAAQGKTDQAGQLIGWSGFTWDSNLFPSPKKFLDWCQARGLKNTLNLHPASGMQPWEEKYSEMAIAMGIDPKSEIYVPFNLTDFKFIQNWNEIVLGPLEEEGVDFWWLDWQQGEDWSLTPVGVNPTFWLNYVFFTNQNRWKKNERPLILHRWGGLGNHRYQIGFSGDVVPSWNSLNFQPYFTSTATNVGYGYWSHDLGGHTEPSPPELYTRWVQWGAFSPIFRTHCTKNAINDRRIWMYPEPFYSIMRDAMKMRASLLPYIYTQARFTYDTGVASLTTPLYYYFPFLEEAYQFHGQYMFGRDLLLAPITQAMNNITQMTVKDIWVPPGSWVEWQSGKLIQGPQKIQRNYSLDEIPIFAKSGSIIPMKTDDLPPLGQAQLLPEVLRISVFPGDSISSETQLYEDDGKSEDYQNSDYSWTRFYYNMSDSGYSIGFGVDPVIGNFEEMPHSRAYKFEFNYVWPAKNVECNGQMINYLSFETSHGKEDENWWTYDGPHLQLIINLGQKVSTHDLLSLNIELQTSMLKSTGNMLMDGFSRTIHRLQLAKQTLDDQWGIHTIFQEDYINLLKASETGNRISSNPSDAFNELNNFWTLFHKSLFEISNLSGNDNVKELLFAQLSDCNFNPIF